MIYGINVHPVILVVNPHDPEIQQAKSSGAVVSSKTVLQSPYTFEASLTWFVLQLIVFSEIVQGISAPVMQFSTFCLEEVRFIFQVVIIYHNINKFECVRWHQHWDNFSFLPRKSEECVHFCEFSSGFVIFTSLLSAVFARSQARLRCSIISLLLIPETSRSRFFLKLTRSAITVSLSSA